MTILSDAANAIAEVRNANTRRALLRALRLSYEADGEGLPISAQDILKTTNLGPKVAARHRVLLTKERLADYLEEFGISISRPSIMRRVNKPTYEDHFRDQRKAVYAGRPMVLSYAEGRDMFGIAHRLTLPPDIEAMLAREET